MISFEFRVASGSSTWPNKAVCRLGNFLSQTFVANLAFNRQIVTRFFYGIGNSRLSFFFCQKTYLLIKISALVPFSCNEV